MVLFPNLKLYVGCALTHATKEFIDEVAQLKEDLREVCIVLDFLGLTDESAYGIYEHDIHNCVMQCHLMLAITDQPSTGLGYEMATQSEKRKAPLLAVADMQSRVSDLILDTRQPGFRFERYENLRKDVTPWVIEELKKINEALNNAA